MKIKNESGYLTPSQFKLITFAKAVMIVFNLLLLALVAAFTVINVSYTFTQLYALYGNVTIFIFTVSELASLIPLAILLFWSIRFFKIALSGTSERLSKGFAKFNIIFCAIFTLLLCLVPVLLGNDSVALALKGIALVGICGFLIIIAALAGFIKSLTVEKK